MFRKQRRAVKPKSSRKVAPAGSFPIIPIISEKPPQHKHYALYQLLNTCLIEGGDVDIDNLLERSGKSCLADLRKWLLSASKIFHSDKLRHDKRLLDSCGTGVHEIQPRINILTPVLGNFVSLENALKETYSPPKKILDCITEAKGSIIQMTSVKQSPALDKYLDSILTRHRVLIKNQLTHTTSEVCVSYSF